ncbi:hypothetical protein [Arthrobacter woluwensis]|uniref:Uncharacterized protein n=1 Tax=Arthrobacter woluwensis TaxID=156980 RepID=A0A1H4KX14_9MICC|nr:hypothetical protein [Arthrobacter woluwensis]SEB62756.1 hypothetical protein SAMN04489745_0822 [Arthrobacter woluwensis]
MDTKYLTTTNPGGKDSLVASSADPYNAPVQVSASEGLWRLAVHRQPDASWVVLQIQPLPRRDH